ncbi:MAG: nucleotidyltransferase family protein [Thermoflavifilum sp.]|nr:nucleotidyltransferase family protein [Thermoflavifilum sp.]MCL6514577.1 nucleotidyltransferase family protein [Alicyclobacillus sp.]
MASEASVAGVVLAAGASRRMGQDKRRLLLPGGDPMLLATLRQALASGVSRWWVTLRSGEASLWQCLQDRLIGAHDGQREIRVLHPIFVRDPSEGMAASIRAAAERAQAHADVAALIVLLGDQPGVSAQVISRCAQLWLQQRPAVVRTRYADGPGHPVVLARTVWPCLLALQGDVGARAIFETYREQTTWLDVAGPAPPDIDTPEAYRSLWQGTPPGLG